MIVAFTTPAMGHVKPMLPLLEGLVQSGEQVISYGHIDFEPVITSTGASFAPYPAVDYDIHAPDFNLVQMAADLIAASQIIQPSLENEVRRRAPKLIVQDFMALWGSRIATALKIPRVHTIPTIVFNATAQRDMRREDGLRKLAGDVLRGAPALLSAKLQSRFAVSVKEAFGIDGAWRRLDPPLCEIVFCLESLQVGQRHGQVPRHYIGPSYRSAKAVANAETHGHALVTFGTLSNTQITKFEAAITGAVMAGYSVIAQCGNKIDLGQIEHLATTLEQRYPGRKVTVLTSVPDLETLIAGAGVVIHHAGMATTWETVRHSVPALFIPTIADQMVLSTQLERNAYGLRLAKGAETDPDQICQALGRLRETPLRLAEIHNEIAAAGGAQAGVGIIRNALEPLR